MNQVLDLVGAKTRLEELKAEARAKAEGHPGCPQAERTALLVIVPGDGGRNNAWRYKKAVTVTALYSPRMEQLALYNPAYFAEKKPPVKDYIYMLYDESRSEQDQVLHMTEAAMALVLYGEELPALPAPLPEETADDLFDKLARQDATKQPSQQDGSGRPIYEPFNPAPRKPSSMRLLPAKPREASPSGAGLHLERFEQEPRS